MGRGRLSTCERMSVWLPGEGRVLSLIEGVPSLLKGFLKLQLEFGDKKGPARKFLTVRPNDQTVKLWHGSRCLTTALDRLVM